MAILATLLPLYVFGLGVGSVRGAGMQSRGRVFPRSSLSSGGAVAELLWGRIPLEVLLGLSVISVKSPNYFEAASA